MRLLSAKEVEKRKEVEGFSVQSKLKKLRGEVVFLENKIRLLKKDLPSEKQKIVQDFQVFCAQIEQKKSEKMKELRFVEDKITEIQDIVDGLILKEDRLKSIEVELKEKERVLNDRERFILASEKRAIYG